MLYRTVDSGDEARDELERFDAAKELMVLKNELGVGAF